MRVLVVANQTLGSRSVFEQIRQINEQKPGTEVHVVVPVTPSDRAPRAKSDSFGRPVVDYLAIDAAEARLGAAISSLSELGMTVTGELGSPDPVRATKVALRRRDYSRIVLATMPAGSSRWLRLDLLHRVGRLTDLPVIHVEGEVELPTARAAVETWESIGLPDAKGAIELLLVDDNEADLELTNVALERAPVECSTRIAKSGEEAIEMATEAAPDLVLLDISMPGLNGLETLSRFKANDALADIPIVMLTTSDRQADRDEAHVRGAAAYVVKENEFSRFEEMLSSLLAEIAIG